MQQRHKPVRRCLACGKQALQIELVRIAKTPLDGVIVDLGPRKVSGRGAYLCKTAKCWETGLKKGRLDHSLKTSITPEEKETLLVFSKTLN
jgi:hypothetical protein